MSLLVHYNSLDSDYWSPLNTQKTTSLSDELSNVLASAKLFHQVNQDLFAATEILALSVDNYTFCNTSFHKAFEKTDCKFSVLKYAEFKS